jgi:hypothetical protein
MLSVISVKRRVTRRGIAPSTWQKRRRQEPQAQVYIHINDVYLTGPKNNSWLFDTGSVANICNMLQELQVTRMLAKDEVMMHIGNGARVVVIAVGMLPLHLPSGFILELSNFYFVSVLCKNIISGYRILQDGYSFKSENNGCSIYMNNIFYGHALIVDGLFIMNLESERNVFNVDAKHLNTNDLNSTYLWHCRLGHIEHKHMKKLHQDGLLESLDTCKACLVGKMAKTPFNGYVERASDLLEKIHTNVCGPMSVPARGGFTTL